MSVVSTKAAVKAKLETLVGATKVLGEVFDEHTGNITKFPAATFEPSGNENDYLSNADNKRSYAFDIYLHQEMKNAGRGTAIDILAAAVDAVITAFDSDFNLGGACDYALALPSLWGEYTGEQGSIKYAQLTIICIIETQVIA